MVWRVRCYELAHVSSTGNENDSHSQSNSDTNSGRPTATIAVIATIAATITYRDMNTMSVSKYNCSYSADHGTAYNYET